MRVSKISLYICKKKTDIKEVNKFYRFFRKRHVIDFARESFFVKYIVQETMSESQPRNISLRITIQHCVLRIAYRATINHTTPLLRYVM